MTTSTQSAAERLRASAERDRALADAATPGPWVAPAYDKAHICRTRLVSVERCPDWFSIQVVAERVGDAELAEFIAASRVIVPRQAEQIRVLVEALEWYADDEHWESNNGWNDYYADVMEDMGNKARTALNAALALEGDDDN